MFERYTERARRVLFFSRYEATERGSVSIETEHILLGLIREGKGLASRLLIARGMSLEDIRTEVKRRAVFQGRVPKSVEVPFSAEGKRVLHSAAEEADCLRDDYIGTEHLLLGLLRQEGSVAAEILIDLGLRLESVRQDIVNLTPDYPSPRDQAFRSVAPRHHPLFQIVQLTPSYDLHVSHMDSDAARRIFTSGGPEYLRVQGFTLRAILARLLNTDERRIEMPPDLDTDERYEFKLGLPVAESWQPIERRLLDGITRHFDISITRERRLVDAYVLTVRAGETLALHRASEQGGGTGAGSIEYSTTLGSDRPEPGPPPAHRGSLHTIGPLSMPGSTLDDLARSLEELLGRPVVDETGLVGRYDIEVRGNHEGVEAFLAALQDQLGLTVTRARHEVEMLVVQRG
jgi:uncharacterized protein (TIGR03435 family)